MSLWDYMIFDKIVETGSLREAADAVHFDTSKLSFEESEQTLLSLIQEKLK